MLELQTTTSDVRAGRAEGRDELADGTMRRRKPTATSRAIGNDERIRISAALHGVQESLNNYRAQISTESWAVPEKYDTHVRDTRRVAGGHMHARD